MYRDGVGVERDLVEAYAWFTVAGDNNVMDGLAYRAEIAKDMTPSRLPRASGVRRQRARKEADSK